jgi:leucyl/phenylalanyl-tRNA--protein transferase
MTSHFRRLDTGLLLRAYAAGLFPMADTRDSPDVFWVEPRRRGLIPLSTFHLPRSLARTLKRNLFTHSVDQAFGQVISACAEAAPGREQSWINRGIEEAYVRLFDEGHAHSVECWNAEGELVGGLYGVRIGGAFFGESMFSRATDASKAALAHLVARLRVGGFLLLDTQFWTPHLARFGGIEVKRSRYLSLLTEALPVDAAWGALDAVLARGGLAGADARAGAALSGTMIVQLLTQTS